jgi:Protein of unknown function (DUF1598)
MMSIFVPIRLSRAVAMFVATVAIGSFAGTGQAQLVRGGAVGGVKVDVDGVLSNPDVSEVKELRAAWQAGLQEVPADLQKPADLRFVSLRRLDEEIARANQEGKPVPDAVRYLAGLQRVRYVLVYPEQHDIVLAGPAEGWRADAVGNIVGANSRRPVLMLEDLMVALRAAESSNTTGISCSIDPTPEGLQRLQQLASELANEHNPNVAARKDEEALGLQQITVAGVPETSHFARVIVAADFRLKRLGMGFEPAPVDGLPSYLTMLGNHVWTAASLGPRFWLAANYEPLRRDKDSLAWEIRGQGVKCLTEQEVMSAGGGRERTGKADPIGQKWADTFTAKFEELSREDSIFGQVRNVMDLAVVSALLSKEGLSQSVGLEIPQLLGGQPLEQYPAPRQVASQASLLKKGRGWIISVSGGVQIYPWQVADRTEIAADVAAVRPTATNKSTNWWWQ